MARAAILVTVSFLLPQAILGQDTLRVAAYTSSYAYEYGPEEREERGERPLMERREVQVYDVFEPEGRFLGTVKFPRRTQLAFVRDDMLWAVQLGEYDEPYVVRYRLRSDG